jgi:hypothetical protein
MPSYKIPPSAIHIRSKGKITLYLLEKNYFDAFGSQMLGLGNIEKRAEAQPAICALFDLQSFTDFCSQIEPHLSVPIFLSDFLDWFFESIKSETFRSKHKDGIAIWHPLPFFTKFMGDGVLVIWNVSTMDQISQHNLIVSCNQILNDYKEIFVPKMQRKVVGVPPVLRCGIAKGTVFSVGDGSDFVGTCVNMAARLQKLHGLRICFNRRGFEPEARMPKAIQDWLLKKVSIRGIGNGELVYVLKTEFEKLDNTDKEQFQDP